jgi:hypothetical protein
VCHDEQDIGTRGRSGGPKVGHWINRLATTAGKACRARRYIMRAISATSAVTTYLFNIFLDLFFVNDNWPITIDLPLWLSLATIVNAAAHTINYN